jgi:hypothetical protein
VPIWRRRLAKRACASEENVKTQEPPVDPVLKQVAELEKAKLKALFEYTKTVAEIEERLSKLLAEGKT